MSETIGVDLGGTKLLAGVVDAEGRVLARERRVVAGLDLPALRAVLADAVGALGTHAPIGLGVPALLDQRTGRAVRCVHLPLDGVHVADAFAVDAVDNDATCAVLAEWQLGAARGVDDVALLTLGTGIGGGLVLGGRIYRGAVGAGGELGHMPVDLDGPPCFGGCPGRGCLEALCSGSALARDTGMSGEAATALALAGDPSVGAVVSRMGTHLGAGLTAITMALNPSLIVVGGGVMALGELLLEPARAELARRGLAPSSSVPVVPASLGPEAGMIGAALLARENA